MGDGRSRRIDHGVLTVFTDDGVPHVWSLTASQARQVALVAKTYEATSTGGTASAHSRSLTRLESLAAYDRWMHGAAKTVLAREYGVSTAAIASAIRRVENGRYGEVPR